MRLNFEKIIQVYNKVMIDISDVRIYGIGAIILILSMGYFVYLLYQDVIFIKKELKEYKTMEKHSYNEEEGDDESLVEYADFVENYEDDVSLESHLDSFMRPHENYHLHTIEEVQEQPVELQEQPVELQEQPVELQEQPVKKRRGRKPKTEEPVSVPDE